MKQIFFSKNTQTAINRIKNLSVSDKNYINKFPVLAKKQIQHIDNWKTFEIKKKRKC